MTEYCQHLLSEIHLNWTVVSTGIFAEINIVRTHKKKQILTL